MHASDNTSQINVFRFATIIRTGILLLLLLKYGLNRKVFRSAYLLTQILKWVKISFLVPGGCMLTRVSTSIVHTIDVDDADMFRLTR
jgi:hypothetical protein